MVADQDNIGDELDYGLSDDSLSEGIDTGIEQSSAGDLDGDEGDSAAASGGQNVDLSQLTDDELAELVADDPQAIRNQAMMQSQFTRESQRMKDEEARLQAQSDELGSIRGGVNSLLQRANLEVPNGEGPLQRAVNQATQQPAQQPDDATPEPGQPATLDEWGDQIVEKAVAAVRQEISPLHDAQRQADAARFQQDTDAKFAELARLNPSIADASGRVKPDIRERIEQTMCDTGNLFDPESAYLKLREPALRRRREVAIAKVKEERGDAPTTKPTRSSTRGKSAPKTPDEKTAAAFAHGKARPQDFVEEKN